MERRWGDCHTRLIASITDELQPQLSDDLIARMQENVFVEDESEIGRDVLVPDVDVVLSGPARRTTLERSNQAVINQPILLQRRIDPIVERSIQIYDVEGNRIVTAIEVLSPRNKKRGVGRRAYLKKRNRYLNSDTNLVEIDLVRTGDWLEMIGPYIVPRNARTTYRVTVSTPDADGPYHYPIPLRSPLPSIIVPLRPQDSPATLELQKLIERAYQMGRYDRTDYTQPCKPPLEGPVKEWADALIAARNSM
jgi:hypothetical protein